MNKNNACLECGDQARDEQSNLCQTCFKRLLKEFLQWELVDLNKVKITIKKQQVSDNE